MADRKFFRTTFRGFSKADVLEHIDTLRAQQQEELKEMQEQVDQAKEESAAARAEADAVIALPAEQLAELESLREKVAAYEKETAELKQQLEQCNQTLAALWAQQEQMQQCIAAAEAFAADVHTLSDQLAQRVTGYVVAPVYTGIPAPETPAEKSAETIEEMVDEVPVDPETTDNAKSTMADWLY